MLCRLLRLPLFPTPPFPQFKNKKGPGFNIFITFGASCSERKGEEGGDAEQVHGPSNLLFLGRAEQAGAAMQSFPGRKSVSSALYGRHERSWGQGEWARLPEDYWGHRLSGKRAASLVLAFLCFRVQRLKTQGIPNFLVL